MKVRVTAPTSKSAVIIIGSIVILLIGISAFTAAGSAAGSVILAVVLVAFVLACARIFRGDREAVEPARPWWKMTARPTAGFIIAGILTAQAVYTLLMDPAAFTIATLIANIFLIAAYLCSSLRLRILDRD